MKTKRNNKSTWFTLFSFSLNTEFLSVLITNLLNKFYIFLNNRRKQKEQHEEKSEGGKVQGVYI